MELVILLLVGMGALAAFVTGLALLVLYWRSSREESPRPATPVAYGNVVQCPRCAYMNPPDTAACLHCGLPFARRFRPPDPVPAPAMGSPQPVSSPSPAPAPAVTVPQQTAPAANLPRAWLEGVGGVMQGQSAWIEKVDTLVGRSNACDIQIFDPKVSRRHFMIRYGRGAFYLQDQQSSRGTLVNGEKVMALRLKDGDQIDIGDTRLVFHVES